MKIQLSAAKGYFAVDGDWRTVDLSGLEPTIQSLYFDTVLGKGRAWHQDAIGDCWQADVLDLALYQVYLDRWTAAAPPPPPPPPPPIDLSDVDNLEKTMKALALCIAQIGGLTVTQMKTLFKQKWDSLP